jgi:hypothetical protein
MGRGSGNGVGGNRDGGRGIGRLGGSQESAGLLAFKQLQLATEVVERPEVARDINENDGEERHDDNHG